MHILNHVPSPFCFNYFSNRVSLTFYLELTLDCNPPTSISCVARITDVCHHVQHLILYAWKTPKLCSCSVHVTEREWDKLYKLNKVLERLQLLLLLLPGFLGVGCVLIFVSTTPVTGRVDWLSEREVLSEWPNQELIVESGNKSGKVNHKEPCVLFGYRETVVSFGKIWGWWFQTSVS
jgi:hypothetical protein